MEKCLVCALVGAVLFFVLTPGVLLTLPPKCEGKIVMALKDGDDGCATSYQAAVVHSLVFALALYLICFFGMKHHE